MSKNLGQIPAMKETENNDFKTFLDFKKKKEYLSDRNKTHKYNRNKNGFFYRSELRTNFEQSDLRSQINQLLSLADQEYSKTIDAIEKDCEYNSEELFNTINKILSIMNNTHGFINDKLFELKKDKFEEWEQSKMEQIAKFLIKEFGDEIIGTNLNDQADKIEIALNETDNGNLAIDDQFINGLSNVIYEILEEQE